MCKKHKIAIAGHSIKDNTIMRLSEYGYEVFLLPANEDLDTPVSSHADLSLFVIDFLMFRLNSPKIHGRLLHRDFL